MLEVCPEIVLIYNSITFGIFFSITVGTSSSEFSFSAASAVATNICSQYLLQLVEKELLQSPTRISTEKYKNIHFPEAYPV